MDALAGPAFDHQSAHEMAAVSRAVAATLTDLESAKTRLAQHALAKGTADAWAGYHADMFETVLAAEMQNVADLSAHLMVIAGYIETEIEGDLTRIRLTSIN